MESLCCIPLACAFAAPRGTAQRDSMLACFYGMHARQLRTAAPPSLIACAWEMRRERTCGRWPPSAALRASSLHISCARLPCVCRMRSFPPCPLAHHPLTCCLSSAPSLTAKSARLAPALLLELLEHRALSKLHRNCSYWYVRTVEWRTSRGHHRDAAIGLMSNCFLVCVTPRCNSSLRISTTTQLS